MPSRLLARLAAAHLAAARAPVAAAATLSLVLLSSVVAARQPAVPPVSEIPAAPPARARKAAAPAAQPPAATTTTITTTTVVTPSLAAMTTEPLLSPPAKGVTEVQPLAVPPAAAAPMRVVLVDEEPARAASLRSSHARARELPEHDKEHGHHARQDRRGRHGRPFHPAPGIVVDVSSLQGGDSSADLQRSARNSGYWPFRRCYEEGLERNQQLAGSVRFGIVRQAGATTTQLVESTVHDESVTLCVLREARHLDLSWTAQAGDPPGDAAADMKVSLATGDEPVPTPRAVPHAAELREALHVSFPAVQQCYASELAKHPDAGGRMELTFHARPSGEIADVAEGEPRFADVDVTRCVLGVYRTAKLPRSHGSHGSSFVYALHFEAAPGAAPAAR